MGTKNRHNTSLCEKSMKVMVNIIKISSLSIAKMSLGTTGPSPVGRESLVSSEGTEPLLPQIPGSRRSQVPIRSNSSKTGTFVMHPGGSDYAIYEENNRTTTTNNNNNKGAVDGWADEYIRKVHEKNSKDAHETSKHAPYIIPPPPLAAALKQPI